MTSPVGVQALIRRTHEDRVLAVLRDRGAMSRAQIAPLVGLSRTTLSEITGSLLDTRAIVVTKTDAVSREGRGRPAELLALDPRAGQHLGADFTHRAVHVAVADASHEIIASGSMEYPHGAEWRVRVEVALALLDDLERSTGVHYDALQGIGIGVSSPVSRPEEGSGEHRTLAGGPLITATIEDAFTSRFDAPILIDNNTRLAALAEAEWMLGQPTRDLIYLRLADGCGGGLVVDGALVSGRSGFAGEIGHVTVEPDGEPCSCGKRGCLETVASLRALTAAAHPFGVASAAELAQRARSGDPDVVGLLARVGAVVGRTLAILGTALSPSEVVLGGQVVGLHPVFLERATEAFHHESLSLPGHVPSVRRARLGDDSGALGALVAAFHNSQLLPTAAPAPSLRTRSRKGAQIR
ncbi:ROK family protein [Leifsonia sp. PS1209]|uniref:ROK family protein n=1 Tax=Leifsonia sp. PS1209 TaxID=2724914 RepID=UPI001442C506|nr:ROK family protein [Leifsonia sp. PS1209]QIZ97453.1 ROK family protein [Leifsonia sp. PS1209]